MAWGGVAAQAAVLVIASLLVFAMRLFSIPEPDVLFPLFFVLITINVGSILVNLFPAEPLDGATAWRVFGRGNKNRKRRRAGSSQRIDLAVKRAQERDRKGR